MKGTLHSSMSALEEGSTCISDEAFSTTDYGND